MAYVDSSGKKHVSLSEASRGYAAQTTASRNAAGQIVGSSSGSNYVRAQEAAQEAAEEQDNVRNSIKYNNGMPAWMTAPGETAGIDRSQLQQFKTVDQLEAEKERGIISRTLSAVKQGYRAGEGKEFSLEGLKAPITKSQDLYSYSFYEKMNSYTEKIDSVQNSLLSRYPSGNTIAVGTLGAVPTKDVIRGVTNLPEIAVGTLGAVPLGLESIARNRESSLDSISFGLGAMAGATVEKARTNPGELAGEIVGALALGRLAGSLESKVSPGLSSRSLKEFSVNERASFGSSGSRLNEANPLRQAAKQKQQMLYKERVAEPKIETYVYSHGRLYPESKLPKMDVLDITESGSKMSGIRGKASARASARMRTQRSKPSQVEEALQESIKEPETALISEPVTVLKSEQTYRATGILKTKQALDSPAYTPVLAYSLPFVAQDIPTQDIPIKGLQVNNTDNLLTSPAVSQVPGLSASQPVISLTEPVNIKLSDSVFNVPVLGSSQIQDSLSGPRGSSGPSPAYPVPWTSRIKMPVLSDDNILNSVLPGEVRKTKRTKKGQLKNDYGDPFKMKL